MKRSANGQMCVSYPHFPSFFSLAQIYKHLFV